jgi:hypothetical protein
MSEEEKKDLLQRVFGMLNDPVRIYQIAEEREVTQDEFQYCEVMYNVVFGEKGFAETLGPTWRMIHDPRFNVIEGLMIVDRHAIFGGDARLGKQYINDDGSFSSTVSDLEKYAEILGEGRNFHNVLLHPDSKCQVRLWLERIYRGFTNLKPYAGFECTCNRYNTETGELIRQDPGTFKWAPDEDVWALIKQECPNRAVTQAGEHTAYGQLMFDLIRADLIGLIHDYAETPLIDSYVYLRDHGVVTATESVAAIDPHGQEAPRVLQEIDILEQALTHRAALRVTAFKILKKLGVERELNERAGNLTDMERDHLLQIIYESDYPEGDTNDTFFRMNVHNWELDIKAKVLEYINSCLETDDEVREQHQLSVEKSTAKEIIEGLKHGSIQPINHYTEPTAEIPQDKTETEVMKYAAMMEAILSNEFKQELYLLMVQAEQVQDTAIVDILSPVFLTPEYPLDEQGFYQILERIRIGSKSLRAERMEAIRGTKQTIDKTGGHLEVKETEGEFHSKDNPGGMLR